jgi:transposase InsO family protein
VPLEHKGEEKLPAVSGSSGHLVVEECQPEGEKPSWPGQVFHQMEYEAAMRTYAQQTRDRLLRQKQKAPQPEKEATPWRKSWEARAKRHAILQQRRQEDANWRAERLIHHQVVEQYRALSRTHRTAVSDVWQAELESWAQRKQAKQTLLSNRKAENREWHEQNRQQQHKRERFWLAILVVTDNCSRQCLSVPVFEDGAKVTAFEVEQALRTILPPGLSFLVSDQGTLFRSKRLAQLAQDLDFIQIPIYRHRPKTNGIAERFVRTLKAWLRGQVWSDAKGLAALLTVFQPEYNQRPHQGLPIPGLSPDEFANRLWLM